VGIGVPGFVDSAEGMVLWSSVLLDREVPLAAAVGAAGLPVTIDNDANLVAAGRALVRGGARPVGFCRGDHRAWRRHGLRDEPPHLPRRAAGGHGTGHTKVQLDGALCRCGQRGCLEAYIADYALAREATTALNWVHKDGQPISVLLESLYDHAKAGNATAKSIFRRAGRYLAVGLSNVINLFDPALIILSGERMRYDYLYAAETLAEMDNLVDQHRSPPPAHRDPRLGRPSLGAWRGGAGPVGGAAIAKWPCSRRCRAKCIRSERLGTVSLTARSSRHRTAHRNVT
jgi:predicted NBD/HSP70 family sugar kinase